MGKPEDGEGGYFIEERGLVTRKESFMTDEIIGVHCNNIGKTAITTSSPEYIHICMSLLSICRTLHFLKVIFLKSQIQHYVLIMMNIDHLMLKIREHRCSEQSMF